MEELVANLKGLENEAVKIQSLENLHDVRVRTQRLMEIYLKISTLPKSMHRNIKSLFDSILKISESKYRDLMFGKFEFEGPPISRHDVTLASPRGHSTNEIGSQKHTSLDNLHSMKLILDRVESYCFLSAISCTIVDMRAIANSIGVKDCTNSILRLNCSGPAYLSNIKNSTIIVTGHQLRLHNSSNCTIIGNLKNNRLMIESCVGILIGSSGPSENGLLKVDDFDSLSHQESTRFKYLKKFPEIAWIDDVPKGVLDKELVLHLTKENNGFFLEF